MIRVIGLGNEMARDDGAGLRAARLLEGEEDVEVVLAGRPGAGLLELLDPARPTLLLDVVRAGASPGAVVELPLLELGGATLGGEPLSSHGLGVAEALKLAEALGRELPRGVFLGIGGARFDPGDALSLEVEARLGDLVTAARAAIEDMRQGG